MVTISINYTNQGHYSTSTMSTSYTCIGHYTYVLWALQYIHHGHYISLWALLLQHTHYGHCIYMYTHYQCYSTPTMGTASTCTLTISPTAHPLWALSSLWTLRYINHGHYTHHEQCTWFKETETGFCECDPELGAVYTWALQYTHHEH